MSCGAGINASAKTAFDRLWDSSEEFGVGRVEHSSGAKILDCGIQFPGGLAAGIAFAEVCLAAKAQVKMITGDDSVWIGPWVQVQTDAPTEACMLGQYAGWPVQHDNFFAMGSGPMRIRRGKEELLTSLEAQDNDKLAVGTLECDKIPEQPVLEYMAAECDVELEDLHLAIAPTRSIAGCVQVVARSVETALHKLHELNFPLSAIQSAHGTAPLCPPIPDFAKGIGRTNDAILYGATVSLLVDADDEQVQQTGEKLPSCNSADFGRPFFEIFKQYEYDFYKIDPGLFSPARVLIMNLRSGKSWSFGGLRPDLVARSFGCES
ncbi:MAG: methenyltetrahydromethanopterin cyclohydrolase [Planctomycetota bacterium]